MLRNYIKLTFRQLWRNKLFTVLNIVGLAIGISATWTIYRIVSYEYSFNEEIPDKERIYHVTSEFKFDGDNKGNNLGVPKPLPEAIKTQVAGIEKVVPIFGKDIQRVKVMDGQKILFENEDYAQRIPQITSDYFTVFPYEWLIGDKTTALNAPNQIVLTESSATLYFPKTDLQKIMGKVITFDDTLNYTVVGIVKNLSFPTDLAEEQFISFKTQKFPSENWGGVNSYDELYIKILPKANSFQINKEINLISDKNSLEELKKWGGNTKRWHTLMPLSNVHFASDYGGRTRHANKTTLNILIAVALFLLILAAINYINMATAQIPQRAKEIGIRKTLGSSQKAMILRFLGETFILVVIAFLFSWIFSDLFFKYYDFAVIPGMKDYIDYKSMLLFALLFILITTLLTGIYPTWIISKFQPVTILRGEKVSGKGSMTLRQGLIIFQFFIANVFIIGMIIVGKQLSFMIHHDLGFDKDAIITARIPWFYASDAKYKDKALALKEELTKLKEIKAVGLGDPLLSNSFSSNTHTYINEKGIKTEKNIYRKYADADMQKVYNIPLLAGRNLLNSANLQEYVINKTAAKAFGFARPQDAIGKFIKENGSEDPIQIVGVVDDFFTSSFHQKIEPTAFISTKDNLYTFNIKLSSKNSMDWKTDIEKIKKVWGEFYPVNSFKVKFYDSVIDEMYKNENNMAEIVNLATFITILISCLGLFGLSTYAAHQRTKEIGIRKVLGASISNIVHLLSKDFLKLVLIAFVLASPLAYFLSNKWLNFFAYHIKPEWWVFVVAGVVVMLVSFFTVSYQSVRTALMNPVKSLKTE